MSETKKPNKKEVKASTTPKVEKQVIGGMPLGTRGRTFEGTVISDKMAKTVTVEWARRKYIPKFERYAKARTKVKAHNEIGAKTGDRVIIKETRPISKTKKFTVVEILQ